MNFVETKIKEDGKLVFGDNEIDISNHKAFKTIKEKNLFGKSIIIGVRPEHIKINTVISKEATMKSNVDVYELLGSEALVHFDLMNKTFIAKISHEGNVNPHQEISITFNVEKIYFFDKESEECIYARQ